MSEDLNIRLLELQNNLTGFEHEEDKVKENISSLKHQVKHPIQTQKSMPFIYLFVKI